MRRSDKRMKGRRGYALLATMILLMVLTLMGSALITLSMNSGRLSMIRRDSEAAFNLAEAGLNHAYSMLKANSNYTGAAGTPLGAGTFDISVAPVLGQPTKRQVTSTGRVLSYGGTYVLQTVTGVIDSGSPPVMGAYAILAKGVISTSGSVTTNSSPNPGAGDIFSNTSISMTGGSTINGSAGAVGSITGGVVTGTTNTGAAPVTFPTLDTAALLAQAQALGTTNGDITVSGSGSQTVSGYVTGKLTSSGSSSITVNGIVYVHGDVTL